MSFRIGVLANVPGGPLTSSAWIRLLLPLQRLEQRGECSLRLLEIPDLGQSGAHGIADLDCLIVQRVACPNEAVAEILVCTCRRQGLPLILDLDDALFALPASHPECERYAPTLPALDHLLVSADLRVYSTQQLAEQCRQRLDAHGQVPGPDSVLINGLDAATWGVPAGFPRADPVGPMKLLYMGSRTHDADLALIIPELDALAARDPQAFRLTLVGGSSHPLHRPWLEVVDVPMEVRRYPRFVRWLRRLPRHDLGLAPLVANAFNAAKSDVKVLDYAALGLPSLCSPGPAYAFLLSEGLALGAEQGCWAKRITWAIRHRRGLRRLAKAVNVYLWEQRSADVVASDWLQLFDSLVTLDRLTGSTSTQFSL